MTGFEHTFIAIACIAVAYYVGRYVGSTSTYMDAFEDGVQSAATAILLQLKKQHGMTFNADIQILETEDDEDE